MSEAKAHKKLTKVINRSQTLIAKVSSSYQQPWSPTITTGVKAVLGKWMTTAARHLAAVKVLAEEHDLCMVGEVHYRQMFEIMLQVRFLALASCPEREKLAQKVSAWGCVDYLEKMKRFKDLEDGNNGYLQELNQLEKYDTGLVDQIYVERKKGAHYWFGKSFDTLAKDVARQSEDLAGAYHLISADIHGSWDITLGVSNPEPGLLDFRGYPNKETLYVWASEQVDRSTSIYVQIWNEIAQVVDAPKVITPNILG